MNIQARIDAFFTLGDKYLNDGNEGFKEVKWKANNQNAWFLPEFIQQATQQIVEQYLQTAAMQEWAQLYPTIPNSSTHKKIGIVMAGNIPMVGFHDLLSVLIAGHTAVIKLSTKDTVLIQYVIDSLIESSPQKPPLQETD